MTSTSLPVLGSFDLADHPTHHNANHACNSNPLGTISADGSTLFFIGDANLVVAPIPALRAVAARASIQRAGPAPKSCPTTWCRTSSGNADPSLPAPAAGTARPGGQVPSDCPPSRRRRL